jgi:parallel beta-helix repeat protein
LPASLRIPSGITLCGQGKETILFLNPKLNPGKTGTAVVNASDDMHDVTLCDLLIEGAPTSKPKTADPNQDRRERSYQMANSRAGINFLASYSGQMKNIRLERVTVSDCTKNGVAILGAAGVTITNCDFSDNGSSVVPGNGIHHNLLLAHVTGAKIMDSRMDTSPWGCGISVTESKDITVSGNELARNKLNGLYVADSQDLNITHNLAEGNDGNGISFGLLTEGNGNVKFTNNYIHYNGLKGINLSASKVVLTSGNTDIGNGK